MAVMSASLLVLLVCLTAYRLTRLVVSDSWPPSEWMRGQVIDRTGEESSWSYLVHCPWCMGMWIAGLVTAATDVAVGLPVPLLVWGAAATACGLIAAIEP